MINCEECGEEIGTKEEIMEDMVEAHKVERNKTVEILCEGCYHEQPLGSLREDYEAETFEAKQIGSIRIAKNPNFPSGTSLQAYIKTNRAELRKVFGNPNMGESGDGKSKGKEWNLIVGNHRVTIYDKREKGKKGTKYFNIGGSGMFGALLVAQALSIHRNERVHAKETVSKWLEDKGHHQRVQSIDEHPDLTYERAMEYHNNRGRYGAETEWVMDDSFERYPKWKQEEILNCKHDWKIEHTASGSSSRNCIKCGVPTFDKKEIEAYSDGMFEAKGYAPDKPFYATTHEIGTTTVMHPIKCGHYKMVMSGMGVWDSPTFYDTIEEMFTDKFDEIMDTQTDGMIDYLDTEMGQETKRKYQAIKTIGDARKFAKRNYDFKIDFAPCFRKERDYDSKALNALPITVAPIYDDSHFNAETFDVEFNEWADQEMNSHGKNISFKDWADDEGLKHGNSEITDWAQHEDESHDARYGAETFEAEEVDKETRELLTSLMVDFANEITDAELLPISKRGPRQYALRDEKEWKKGWKVGVKAGPRRNGMDMRISDISIYSDMIYFTMCDLREGLDYTTNYEYDKEGVGIPYMDLEQWCKDKIRKEADNLRRKYKLSDVEIEWIRVPEYDDDGEYGEFSIQIRKKEMNAERKKRDSCCCGATKTHPCACMIQGIETCSATCPCSLEKKGAESHGRGCSLCGTKLSLKDDDWDSLGAYINDNPDEYNGHAIGECNNCNLTYFSPPIEDDFGLKTKVLCNNYAEEDEDGFCGYPYNWNHMWEKRCKKCDPTRKGEIDRLNEKTDEHDCMDNSKVEIIDGDLIVLVCEICGNTKEYVSNEKFSAENWGGDPKGKLALALQKARDNAKEPKKPLKIEKLGAEHECPHCLSELDGGMVELHESFVCPYCDKEMLSYRIRSVPASEMGAESFSTEGKSFVCDACEETLPLKLRNRSKKVAQEFGMGIGDICRPCVKRIKSYEEEVKKLNPPKTWADYYNAPTKGIDTFTQPFEESSLDSGTVKSIVVGLGIGALALFGYNKWK